MAQLRALLEITNRAADVRKYFIAQNRARRITGFSQKSSQQVVIIRGFHGDPLLEALLKQMLLAFDTNDRIRSWYKQF